MREIKFRAWDRLCKRYWYSGFDVSRDGRVRNLCREIQDARIKAGWTLEKSYTDVCKFDLDQYTGLKDKDWYFDDILESSDKLRRYVIRWDCMYLDGIDNAWCVHGNEIDWDEYTKIGNLHENPELLSERE